MTHDEVLQLLLHTAEFPDRAFRMDEVIQWPEDALAMFEQMNLLCASSAVMEMMCTSCGEHHVERVIRTTRPNGDPRYFIPCQNIGRVEVSPETCRGWEIDRGGLARLITKTMKLKGSRAEIVSSRLWRLGRVPYGGKTRDVLLAMGLHLQDAGSIALQVGPKGRSIVLVPSIVPDGRIWPDVVPAVIALDQIASVENGKLMINGQAFMDMIAEADEYKDRQSILPVDPAIKKEVAGRMVTHAIDARKMDELCIQARKATTSYIKAAEMLTKELGQPISKDRIYRAFKRESGFVAAMASTAKKRE